MTTTKKAVPAKKTAARTMTTTKKAVPAKKTAAKKPVAKRAGAPKTDAARDAVQFARDETKRPSEDWERLCLRFVRKCWGVPMREATAKDAWLKAKKRHSWNGLVDDIPFGAPVFSRNPNAGPDDAWHVFIACGYYNDVRIFRSNDIKVKGEIDACAINLFTERWGHEILGWTEDINGVTLDLPPSPNSVKA